MSKFKLFATNIAILVAGILAWKIWASWGEMEVPEKFVIFLLLCVAIGVPVVAYVVPQIGDKIGDFFYSAPEQVEEDAYAKAAATLTRGEYDEAVAAYTALSKDNPRDRFPIVEISKILLEKKEDVSGSIAVLEQALERGGWRENDEAFFLFRLAEIYQKQLGEPDRAREYLDLVLTRFPDTRHSANATHRLHELSKAV